MVVLLVGAFQVGRLFERPGGLEMMLPWFSEFIPDDEPEQEQVEIISGRPRVSDGDSLEFPNRRVRLFGIDAFERGQKCEDKEGRRFPCGHVAMRALESMVRGKVVECEVRAIDSYERAVSVCRIGRTDLAAELVREGYAVAYRRYSRAYIVLEREARAAGRGAWSGTFEDPWEWRQRNLSADGRRR